MSSSTNSHPNTTNSNSTRNPSSSSSTTTTTTTPKTTKSVKKLRPLSLSKLPRLPHLSKGLPSFDIHDPSTLLPSPSSSSSPPPPNSWTNTPPRTNWNVSDSNLRSIPTYHPPMIPTDCTFVSDASASVIAARIAFCLAKRSLIAEYDDENAKATVLDVETGSFGIGLYQGNRNGPRMGVLAVGKGKGERKEEEEEEETTVPPDFSQGVVVECTRIRGDVMVFHRNCQAVLASARGETSDGWDGIRRSSRGAAADEMRTTSRFGFGPVGDGSRMKREETNHNKNNSKGGWDPNHTVPKGLLPPPSWKPASLSSTSIPFSSTTTTTSSPRPQSDMAQSVCLSLQKALSRLENDGRYDLQLLGLQSLALLTDVRSSRLESAYLASLCVLGSPMTFAASLDMNYSPADSLLGGVVVDDDDDGFGEDGEEEERMEGSSTFGITRIHERVRAIVMQTEYHHTIEFQSSSSSHPTEEYPSSCLSTEDAPSSLLSNPSSDTTPTQPPPNPELHLSMRRTAIQSLINSLSTILSHSHRFPLLPPLHCETLHWEEFIQCLALDITGATRPPMVSMPLLGNAHDAALSSQLLHRIVVYHTNRSLVRNNHDDNMSSRRKTIHEGNIGDTTVGIPPKKLSDLLERARVVGSSCHCVLEVTAERALRHLGIESK